MFSGLGVASVIALLIVIIAIIACLRRKSATRQRNKERTAADRSRNEQSEVINLPPVVAGYPFEAKSQHEEATPGQGQRREEIHVESRGTYETLQGRNYGAVYRMPRSGIVQSHQQTYDVLTRPGVREKQNAPRTREERRRRVVSLYPE